MLKKRFKYCIGYRPGVGKDSLRKNQLCNTKIIKERQAFKQYICITNRIKSVVEWLKLLRSTWFEFKTYSRYSVVSLGKTPYGSFSCLAVCSKFHLYLYKTKKCKILTRQQYLGFSVSRSG